MARLLDAFAQNFSLYYAKARQNKWDVIQARSVVCKDVPPLAIAGGHPAVMFKKRDEAHYYKLKCEGKFM